MHTHHIQVTDRDTGEVSSFCSCRSVSATLICRAADQGIYLCCGHPDQASADAAAQYLRQHLGWNAVAVSGVCMAD
jgi:hypothetical protein